MRDDDTDIKALPASVSFRFVSYDVNDVWSCDLVEMQEWSKQNKGFRYMLNVIDVLSKYAWSIPLKNKTGKTVHRI